MKYTPDLVAELIGTLMDLVEAFPPGQSGMDLASEFGADGPLFSARALLQALETRLQSATSECRDE